MKKIAFVTTSSGRLHHIKQTVPLLLAQEAAEVIVVDYACPDDTGGWVASHCPWAKVVRVEDDPVFCGARARNLGAAQSQADWLVFIDADIITTPGWHGWMQDHLQPGHFYCASSISGTLDPDTYGTIICARSDFEAIGGYDEVFNGWGGEDDDLFNRLARHGVARADYPAEFVTAIRHGNEERAGWGGMASKAQKSTLNHCYMALKMMVAEHQDPSGPLSVELRSHLMDSIQRMLQKWYDEGARGALPISYVLRRNPAVRVSPLNTIKADLSFTIYVRSDPIDP